MAKSKLTPAAQKKLCDAVEMGNYYEAACQYAGIHYATFRRWQIRGEEEEAGPYRELCDALTRAEFKCELRLIELWQKAMPGDWRAVQNFLSRRFNDRWGEVKTVKAQVDLESELERMAKDAGLTPEQTAAALETAKKLLAKEG